MAIYKVGGIVKKISKQAARDKIIDNVIASLRIENLAPSETVVQDLRDCLVSKETTRNVLARVLNRHVKVRRGQ